MTKRETKIVKKELANVDVEYVHNLLAKVNLTKSERKIIEHSELDKERLLDIAESLCLSVDRVACIKMNAMQKVYKYLVNKNYIKSI